MMVRYLIFFLVGWLYCCTAATALAKGIQLRHRPIPSITQVYILGDTAPSSMPCPLGSLHKVRAQRVARSNTIPLQNSPSEQRHTHAEASWQWACIYSMILPGLGQVYNAHYWKAPMIYTVFAGLAWGAYYHHQHYASAKSQLKNDRENSYLHNYVDTCRRSRDIFCFLIAFGYLANIFDAYVGASLTTFDLSDDISLEVRSSATFTAAHFPKVGLYFTLTL